MKKIYKIRYLSLFYEDLDKITQYISNNLKNNKAVNNLLDEIEKEILNRQYNPQSYEKYLSNKTRKDIYYRIYVKNYIIFYTVKDNVMEIRRILYGKRNLNELI